MAHANSHIGHVWLEDSYTLTFVTPKKNTVTTAMLGLLNPVGRDHIGLLGYSDAKTYSVTDVAELAGVIGGEVERVDKLIIDHLPPVPTVLIRREDGFVERLQGTNRAKWRKLVDLGDGLGEVTLRHRDGALERLEGTHRAKRWQLIQRGLIERPPPG